MGLQKTGYARQFRKGSHNSLATEQQQNTFPIFKLPIELRLKIYYHSLITTILNYLGLDYNRSDIRLAELTNPQNIDRDGLISGDWGAHRMILDQAYNFFLACQEFQCEGRKTFWGNFPFAFTYNNLSRFIKSLTLPALSQVRYLKMVVSESDCRYRSIWRFHRFADAFLAQHTFENGDAEWREFFPRYIPSRLQVRFENYYVQRYDEFFNKRIGE